MRAPNLIDGWRDQQQIDTNDRMLRNLMAALEPAAPALRHVALLQGTKAYGSHVRPLTVPAREGRSEMYEQPNFYWAQENFLRELQKGKALALQHPASGPDRRPRHGRRDGSDPAARRLCRDAARAGPRPRLSRRRAAGVAGGRRRSAGARHRLVAAKSDAARNEAFNVTNGDVFTWENVWPAVADALGMKPGKAVPLSLAQEYPEMDRAVGRAAAQARSRLAALEEFVGLSFQYADYSMRYGQTQPGPPSIVSTVKINQAGFTEMMDTEAMFRKWFAQAKASSACCLRRFDANAASIALRVLTVSLLASNSTSLQRTTPPWATSFLSLTRWASPIGSAPAARLACCRHQLAPHRVAAFAVEHFAGAQIAFLATEATSPRKPCGWPVGSLRSAADRIEMFSSSPIR